MTRKPSHSTKTMMVAFLLLVLDSCAGAPVVTPEQAFESYTKAFVKQDFAAALEWFHPDYLKEAHETMREVIRALRPDDQVRLLKEYGLSSWAEFESMDVSEFMARQMATRFRALSDDELASIRATTFHIIESVPLPDGQHLLKVRGQRETKGQTHEKIETYRLKLDGDIWKISGSDTYDRKWKGKRGLELYAPNQAL